MTGLRLFVYEQELGMINPQDLPPAARSFIALIEAHLREAQPLLQSGAENADAFALRETQRRYLPETIQLFMAVPQSLREAVNAQGESASTQLIKSLAILENATLAHLQNLASAKRDAAEINQQFLAERFSGISATEQPLIVPAAPNMEQAIPPSTFLIQELFSQATKEAAGNQQQLLDAIAAKFSDAFPRITRVERRLFSRAVKRVEVEIPSSKDAVRYILSWTPYGFEAGIATMVRGIALKTETLPTENWIATIVEHLADFTSKNQETEARLKEFFGTR